MYPKWIVEIFTNNKCVHCQSAITVDEIEAIGLQCPAPAELYNPQPFALVIAACASCHQRTHFTLRMSMHSIIGAIRALSSVIVLRSSEAPPNVLGLPFRRVQPSRRKDQPSNQPTEAEYQAFMDFLNNTSFRRSSRSFQAWLKRMGIDPDQPPSDGTRGK